MEFLYDCQNKILKHSKAVILGVLFYLQMNLKNVFKLVPIYIACSLKYKFLIDYLIFIFLPHAILSMNISGFSEKGHVNCSVYFLSIICNFDFYCILF